MFYQQKIILRGTYNVTFPRLSSMRIYFVSGMVLNFSFSSQYRNAGTWMDINMSLDWYIIRYWAEMKFNIQWEKRDIKIWCREDRSIWRWLQSITNKVLFSCTSILMSISRQQHLITFNRICYYYAILSLLLKEHKTVKFDGVHN